MLVTSLLLMLGNPAAPAPKVIAPATDDPPIRVWLNDNNYGPGDRATVKLRLADDGYVVVLRADGQGHLRILFPLDPGADNFVKGGKTFEVRGRGDRDAFQVDNEAGSGTIFAAVSAQPFSFTGYVLGDHWDYKVLSAQNIGDDPEADLVDLVHAMAGANHFDYDVTTYTVSAQSAAEAVYPTYYPCWGCGPWYPGGGVFIGVGFGRGFYSNACWADPFWCDYYGGFGYGYGFGYGFGWGYGGYRRPFYSHYGIYNTGYRPFAPAYRPPFVVPARTVTRSVPVRPRFVARSPAPAGGTARRGSSQPATRSAPPSRGGREAQPARSRGRSDFSWGRGSAPASRPESRPSPRVESRPAPRFSAPRASAPSRPSSPRSGGGGGGRGGRHR